MADLVNAKTVYSELEKYKPELEAALPRHLNPDRLARIALTELRKTPKLFNCTKESFMGSILMAAQLGLEPGILGQCYLIPYKENCTFVPGWRGLMDLLARAQRASAWTRAVFDGDEFDYEYGDRPFVHHKEGKWTGTEAAMTHAYACGKIAGIEQTINDVWDIDKIWAHRNRFNKVGDKHYSYAHPEMYARKIPLLQVLKYLPSSVELAIAQTLELSGSEGKQRLTLEGVIRPATEIEETEVEELMERLDWKEDQRDKFRDTYQGRTKEAVVYLKDLIEKQGRVTKPAGADKPKNGGGALYDHTTERKDNQQQSQTAKPAQESKPTQESKPAQTQPAKGGGDWFTG